VPSAPLKPSEIDQLQALLIAQQRDLEALLGSAQTDTRPVALDQQSVGRVSRIDAIQQQQMAIASQQQASRQLRAIEQALQHIDRGEFGECRECGEAIAFARLQAQPFARLCIDCQSASEQAGQT
jgi:DnaK suppressor protein